MASRSTAVSLTAAQKKSLDEVLGDFFMRKPKKRKSKGVSACSAAEVAKPAAGVAEAAAESAAKAEPARAAAAEAEQLSGRRPRPQPRKLSREIKQSPFVVEEPFSYMDIELPEKCLPRTGSYAPTDEEALQDFMPPDAGPVFKRKVSTAMTTIALERFRKERIEKARQRWVPPRVIEEVPDCWESRCGATRPPPGEGCQQRSFEGRYTGCMRDESSAPRKWLILPENLLHRLDAATADFLEKRWLAEAQLVEIGEKAKRRLSGAKGKRRSNSGKLRVGWQAQFVRPGGMISTIQEESELELLEANREAEEQSPAVPSGRAELDVPGIDEESPDDTSEETELELIGLDELLRDVSGGRHDVDEEMLSKVLLHKIVQR